MYEARAKEAKAEAMEEEDEEEEQNVEKYLLLIRFGPNMCMHSGGVLSVVCVFSFCRYSALGCATEKQTKRMWQITIYEWRYVLVFCKFQEARDIGKAAALASTYQPAVEDLGVAGVFVQPVGQIFIRGTSQARISTNTKNKKRAGH